MGILYIIIYDIISCMINSNINRISRKDENIDGLSMIRV